MAKNLDELKEELYQSFNDARKKAAETVSLSAYNYPEPNKVGMMALEAAAKIAGVIVKVEHELADRNERKNGIPLPGKN